MGKVDISKDLTLAPCDDRALVRDPPNQIRGLCLRLLLHREEDGSGTSMLSILRR